MGKKVQLVIKQRRGALEREMEKTTNIENHVDNIGQHRISRWQWCTSAAFKVVLSS